MGRRGMGREKIAFSNNLVTPHWGKTEPKS